jgi:hypothetical protein
MTDTPPSPTLTISQNEIFASLAQDVVLFEKQLALTEGILAGQRRRESVSFIDGVQIGEKGGPTPALCAF